MASSGITIEADVRKLRQLANDMPSLLEATLASVAEELVNDVKLSMTNSPATGESYRRGSRVHVASSSPNPPRPDMGTLIASIRWQREKSLTYRIEDGVEYGIAMELGTENIEPRPFMRPMFEDYRASKFGNMVKQKLGL